VSKWADAVVELIVKVKNTLDFIEHSGQNEIVATDS
jgi:hypothetical protein